MGDQAGRRTVYELEFTKYGLTARVRKPGFRGLRLLARAERVLGVGLGGQAVTGPQRLDGLAPAVTAFAESLLWWDLTDRGVPVPATLRGIEAQDYEFVVDLVTTWYRRVVMSVERSPEPTTDQPPTGTDAPTDELEDELAGLITYALAPTIDPATNEPPVGELEPVT